MTENLQRHYTLLDELDTRQNQVLHELDELNRRIEQLLTDCTTETLAADSDQSIRSAA